MVVERRTMWMGAGALAVVAVVVAIWSAGGQPTAASGPTPRAAREQAGKKGAPADDGPIAVNLDALQGARLKPVDGGRDPFRFQARRVEPDPDAAPPRPTRPGGETAITPVEPPPPPMPMVPPGPPPPPPIPVKLFGIAEQGGRKVAMLTDGHEPMAYVEGDIAYGQYRILKIGQESIEMAYTDGRGRQTIRLSGQ